MIQEEIPRVDNVEEEDWVKLVGITNFQAAGFISIELGNTVPNDDLSEPFIAKGSKLEMLGGTLFYAVDDEEVENEVMIAGRYFIYAVPSQSDGKSSLSFRYDTIRPAWIAERGGWYKPGTDGKERAIAFFYYNGAGQYQTKVILDSFNAMYNPVIKIQEWQRGFLRLNTTYQPTHNVTSDNLHSNSYPIINAGSIVEVNGTLFELTNNATIANNLPNDNNYYDCCVFAYKNGNDIAFELNRIVQTAGSYTYFTAWDSIKNGVYLNTYTGNRERRAIIKLYAMRGSGNGYYNGKTILDSFASFNTVRTDFGHWRGLDPVEHPSNRGKQFTFKTDQELDNNNRLGFIDVEPGLYYYELRGAPSGMNGVNDNSRNIPEPIKGWFVWQGGRMEYGIGQAGGSETSRAGGGGMSFLGPIIAHGGAPGQSGTGSTREFGYNAGGVFGGYSFRGYSPQNRIINENVASYIRLWRCW